MVEIWKFQHHQLNDIINISAYFFIGSPLIVFWCRGLYDWIIWQHRNKHSFSLKNLSNTTLIDDVIFAPSANRMVEAGVSWCQWLSSPTPTYWLSTVSCNRKCVSSLLAIFFFLELMTFAIQKNHWFVVIKWEI